MITRDDIVFADDDGVLFLPADCLRQNRRGSRGTTRRLQGRNTMLSHVTPADCLRAHESASAKLDVKLPDLEAAWLHAHLCACADCAAYAREIGGIVSELRAAPLVPLPRVIEVPRMS